MAIPRRLILLLTATFLLLLVAMLLATAIEIRAPPPKMMAVTLAQAAKYGESEREIAAKALLNGTDFDRGDILNGTTIAPAVYTPTMTRTDEGMIGDQCRRGVHRARPYISPGRATHATTSCADPNPCSLILWFWRP
jgi:hypothetical protein